MDNSAKPSGFWTYYEKNVVISFKVTSSLSGWFSFSFFASGLCFAFSFCSLTFSGLVAFYNSRYLLWRLTTPIAALGLTIGESRRIRELEGVPVGMASTRLLEVGVETLLSVHWSNFEKNTSPGRDRFTDKSSTAWASSNAVEFTRCRPTRIPKHSILRCQPFTWWNLV